MNNLVELGHISFLDKVELMVVVNLIQRKMSVCDENLDISLTELSSQKYTLYGVRATALLPTRLGASG